MRDSNWSTAWAMLFAIFCLGGAVCAAQQPPEPPAMTVQRVRGEIFAVKGGSGANTGFAICDQGVIAIDAKMTADSTRRLVAEVARLTPKPILSILLTHSDGDHVNGLTGFPAGLPILAHENTKKDMEAAFKDVALQALRAYLPNRTIPRVSISCISDRRIRAAMSWCSFLGHEWPLSETWCSWAATRSSIGTRAEPRLASSGP
jgi:hypothetical protein